MADFRVLIVDDEWNMRNLLRIYLTQEGFEVREASTGAEALALTAAESFDLVLLDVMMPDMDGWQVCRKIREAGDTAVIMLTARSETKDKVTGLTIGADDYVTKPFEPEELIARIYSLLRRSSAKHAALLQEQVLEFDRLKIFPDKREVLINGVPVDFTQKEFDLLAALAGNRHRVFTREELVTLAWGYDYDGDPRVVDTHVKNIREKTKQARLGYNPLQTVWGVGYKFNEAGDADGKQ